MRGHWRLQNGVIPNGPSRRFHEIYLLPLPLGSRDTTAHYHRKGWPQRTEFSVGKSNVKWEPDFTSEVADATTAYQVRPHQVICHCS